MHRALILVFAAAVAMRAAAQQGPWNVGQQSAAPASARPPLEAGAAPLTPAGEAYRRAFERMVEGQWSEAAAAFREITIKFPGTREADLSAEMLRLATALQLRVPVLGESRVSGPDRSGRAELAVNASLFGLWTGIALSIMADLGNASLLVTSGTTALGLTTSLVLTREGRITSGGAALVGTGIMFGTFDGALVAVLVDLSPKPAVGLTLGAGAVGLMTAALVQSKIDVSSGGVAITTAGGYLGTFLAGMALLGFKAEGKDTVAATLLAGANLGLVGGALWASRTEVSRGRVLICELGGLLGGLAAGGVLAAANRDPGRGPVAAALTAGVLVGTGLAIYLTRDFDVEEGATRHAAMLAPPTPLLIPGAGNGPAAVGLGLLQGSF